MARKGLDAASGYHKRSIKKAQEDAFSGFAVKDDVGWSDYWMNASHEEYTAGYGDRGAYVDQLQDIRKSLEFMQSYRYSDNGKLASTDFGVNEFEGSREFRNKVTTTIWACRPGSASITSATLTRAA